MRTVRNVLASLLAQHATQGDDETLRTFMVEAEAIVNCRPLTVDTINSPQMPEPLTPSYLLTMKSKVILPRLVNFNVLICTPENDGGQSSSWSTSFG